MELLSDIKDLTDLVSSIYGGPNEGQTMKGTIRPISRQAKCPTCGKPFQHFPKLGYICLTCKTKPDRFFIDIYWKGQRLRISSDKLGNSIDTYDRAYGVLSKIRTEIAEHTFDSKNYIKAEVEKYFFENKINGWIAQKEIEKNKGKIAPSTLKVYKVYVKKYYIPFFKNNDVREIRSGDIKAFYLALPNAISLKYQKCLMTTLANFFNTLVEEEVIIKKPSFKSVEITVPETTPEWIDRATQDSIISAIEDNRDKLIYVLLTRQGIRPSEGRALKVKDFDFGEGTITVSRTFSEHEIVERNKEKKVKTRLLNPALLPMLKEVCKNKFPEDFVFINFRTGKPYNSSIINKIWNDACKKVKVNIRLYCGTRHSVASQAGRTGIPDSGIQQILNHADIRTSKKYINKDDLEAQRVIFEKVNNVVRIKKPEIAS
jgi:integrase